MHKYLKDSFTYSGFGVGGTYIGYIPGLRIDYIWHDKKLSSFNYTTYNNELSDHKAISVDIVLAIRNGFGNFVKSQTSSSLASQEESPDSIERHAS